MILTGMREIIELIRKHQKLRRILRCESPYFHHCHSPTSRFPSSSTSVVITEPFPDRTRPLRHMSKEMGSYKQWNVCLRRHPDNVTCRWFQPADYTPRWSTMSVHATDKAGKHGTL